MSCRRYGASQCGEVISLITMPRKRYANGDSQYAQILHSSNASTPESGFWQRVTRVQLMLAHGPLTKLGAALIAESCSWQMLSSSSQLTPPKAPLLM